MSSLERYYMASGKMPDSLDELDVTPPQTSLLQIIVVGKDHVLFQMPSKLKGLYYMWYPYFVGTSLQSKHFCNVESGDASVREEAKKICRAVSGREPDNCGTYGCRYPMY